jgi:phenylacetate-coenzyme A ligase PaaK-like adenylate-forming protein
MNTLQLLTKIIEFKRQASFTREQIQNLQKENFRTLLHFVFDNSVFYRDLYTSHGINKQNLNEVTISDLPFTSKEIHMKNFDAVVTDKRLTYKKLDDWIEQHQDTKQIYENEYIVLHTSGTSGFLGIFIYDQKAWTTLKASLVARVSTPNLNPFHKNKMAFYAATHGRFAGVTLINDVPKLLYDTRTYSLLTPLQQTIERLNAFQPDQLSGYASTIAHLAQFQQEGKLNIAPKRIMTSGDPLTEANEKKIQETWHPQLVNLYACSESLCIGARLPGTNFMRVFDDLHIVEILDGKNKEVNAGDPGHVVLTNLYNQSFPLIRYQMKDIAVRGNANDDKQFSSITKIIGRLNDALPILLDNNTQDFLNPLVLSSAPGVEKIQFISENPNHIRLKYIAGENLDKEVREDFMKLLQAKGATKSMKLDVEKVSVLPNDPKTGKFKLVKVMPS